jgi:arylsulfatase A-like enzyme
LPGVAAAEITCPVGLVDLMVTVCDYFDIPCPARVAGESLIAAEEGAAAAGVRYLVSEGVPVLRSHRTIQNERYKLIFAPGGPNIRDRSVEAWYPPRRFALYDLAADPDEDHDLLECRFRRANGASAVAQILRREMETAVPAFETPAAQSAPLDADLERRLRELGYLQSE